MAGGSHTPFQGAEYAGSGVMLWTCTGIGTWTALVDGKGSVAEIGEIRPFQPHFCKHLDSRAGSGRGVHRPYWKGAVGAPAESGRGVQGPYLKTTICAPGDAQASRVCGAGRAGVRHWPRRAGDRRGWLRERGTRSRVLRATTAAVVETGPWRRVRATALQAGRLTLAGPAATAVGENVGELPVMALVGQLRRQDAFVEAPDTGPWWRVWARACGSGGGACRQLS